MPNPARELSLALLRGGRSGWGGGGREEEGRAPLPQLYERGTFGTFTSISLIDGVRLIEVYKNCTMFVND